MGTSLPDTFASKIAAKNEKTADNAIGNVTGSNSVNVFLGLGLPWVIAAIYWHIQVFISDSFLKSIINTIFFQHRAYLLL
jgi:Ca2+/Na+ antiporter